MRPRIRASRPLRVVLCVGAVLAIVGAAMAAVWLGGSSGSRADASGAASPTAKTTATASTSASNDATTPGPTATSPYSPPLPTMLAAIGDSYTLAYDVSPDLPHHQYNVEYSWVIGDAKGDGVFSLRERFEALGGSPVVVNAALSGRKMDDAVRQANEVVAAAQSLRPGSTVYVTFELGTNDVCDEPKTDPATFDRQLREAMSVLRGGLPHGSRILVMSVPDFGHLHDITQANLGTREFFATLHPRRCAPFLGASSPTPLSDAKAILAKYDTSLVAVCDEIEAADGPSGTLHCTSSRTGLALRDFKVADLSAYDFFHPSYSGQARMAAAAWTVGPWGEFPLPPDAAQ